ncbi:MAG: histidine phosphatase family protein [Intrasporangium sp.]|uniref:histidine phosphatase family protein n=1 Tax=Intrasporangium sp. TaxID=1925024 RepID=UPI00264A21BE|nr:histidine phosphatase family protein [Intrasporangium sp.]MDN5796444.1 histidine phosphatase family protein [Intrasporangium sp.]
MTGSPTSPTPPARPGPTRTVIHLMRHGEVHNPSGVLYGRLPGYHLSELGFAMADTVAAHLESSDLTLVLASPLERAQQTAAPIAERHHLPVETDARLIESANHFQGHAFTKVSLLDPRLWPKVANVTKPSWGEPYEAIAGRMLAAIADARTAASGHEALLVSHQLPIWTVRNRLQERRLWHDPRKRECTLASLTSLYYVDDELDSIAYSEPAGALLARASKSVGA